MTWTVIIGFALWFSGLVTALFIWWVVDDDQDYKDGYDDGYQHCLDEMLKATSMSAGSMWLTLSPTVAQSYLVTPESLHIEPDEPAN